MLFVLLRCMTSAVASQTASQTASQGYYSRWGQLAYLTRNCSLSGEKRNKQKVS